MIIVRKEAMHKHIIIVNDSYIVKTALANRHIEQTSFI